MVRDSQRDFEERQSSTQGTTRSFLTRRALLAGAIGLWGAVGACSSGERPSTDTAASPRDSVITGDPAIVPGSLRICLTTEEVLADARAIETVARDSVIAPLRGVIERPSRQDRVEIRREQAEVRRAGQTALAQPYAVALLANLRWPAGITLRVRFLNGSTPLQDRVFQIAQTWQQHARVTFVRSDEPMSEVRISFDPNHRTSWSRVGRAQPEKFMNPSDPTMVLGGISLSTSVDTLNAVVLHEFGHALGLVHELQHPDRVINWDIPATYTYYRNTYNWPEAEVDKWVFRQYRHPEVDTGTYDASSIMHYAVPPQLTRDRHGTPFNTGLSKHDVTFIARIY